MYNAQTAPRNLQLKTIKTQLILKKSDKSQTINKIIIQGSKSQNFSTQQKMDNNKGTKNTGKQKHNMHQNKKKTCMRRTTRKEKQNLICRRKNAQQQNKARREAKVKTFPLNKKWTTA